MTKRYAKNQTRGGNPARRALEYAVVMDQLDRRAASFSERLKRHIYAEGGCMLHDGTLDHNGYPRINFRYRGAKVTIHVMRVVLILKTLRPIPEGYEAAHVAGCKNRRCVAHVELQHYKTNCVTRGGKL